MSREVSIQGIVLMVLISLLSSLAASAARRPPAAFATLTHHATRKAFLSSSSSLAAAVYSETTLRRTMGKDRRVELTKMAQKMNLDESQLEQILVENLRTMDPTTEKAEYIDWLLSSSSAVARAKRKSAGLPTTPTKKTLVKTVATRTTAPTAIAPKKKTVVKKKNGENQKQTFATNVLFADRQDLHPLSKRAVAQMGLTSMTEIQDRTFEAASTGRDVLGRARTGTGKTVAFLLPAIERILQSEDYKMGSNIGIVVVSPTRELATQIADQAEKLLAFHPKGMSVQVMFGGTNTKRDITQLQRQLPAILVATPGRLLDHLQTAMVGGRQFGRDIMSRTPVVVLDETDRLLDMGFRREISKILNFLPKGEKRQTLLFSATIPPDCKSSSLDLDF